MLKIATDTVPQSLLSYVAFRVALWDTWDRLSHAEYLDSPGGFLGEVPFLREVPLHVQVDLLAITWHRHLSRNILPADLVDEAVLYAVCETTARLSEQSPSRVIYGLRGGPLDLAVPVDHVLAAEIRGLYLNLSNEGDFLLVSQFLDMPPEAADHWKRQLGVEQQRLDPLFDVLGRWNVSPEWSRKLHGLLTDTEVRQLAPLFKAVCPA